MRIASSTVKKNSLTRSPITCQNLRVADNPTDTGWKPIIANSGDGDVNAGGRIALDKGNEQRPCYTCKSFDPPNKRVVEHVLSKGITISPEGVLDTKINKDFKGRRPPPLNIKDLGFCRRDGIVTDLLATCPAWRAKRLVEDFR